MAGVASLAAQGGQQRGWRGPLQVCGSWLFTHCCELPGKHCLTAEFSITATDAQSKLTTDIPQDEVYAHDQENQPGVGRKKG